MPSQQDPDRPTNPPEHPATPVAISKTTSKGTSKATTTTQQQFVKLQQRVESRRSARSRNHLQDPILAPGFGTQRDLQRLARELTQASASHEFTVEAIQCLMERRGRGLRHSDEETPAAAATSSAWDDFMKEAGMGAATPEADPVVTGKRGRSSVAAEVATAASMSTSTASREYNLEALESSASRNKKMKPDSSSHSGGILLQTGTLDCAVVGRKMADLNWAAPYTLSVPTRVLSNSIKIQKVIAAGHACHCIAITTKGIAYGWGRNEQMQLGSSFPKNVYQPAPLFSERDPIGDLVTDAAVGKGHSLLLLRSGQIMACGSNKSGQCGINSTSIEAVPNFRICTFATGGDTPTIIQVACGEDFSVALCSEGKIYSTGSSEFGQLGNGSTGEYFLAANKLAFANCATFTRRTTFCHAPNEKIYSTSDTNTKVVPLSEDIRIQQIACGKHHTIALEADAVATGTNVLPRLFTWGCGNYGVLGHGVQADEYYPRNVGALGNLHFTASGPRRIAIAAGQHCSLLLTAQGHVYYWGKHRMVGEATMRPALVDALAHNDHIVTHCAAGGQTVVCCTVHGQSVGWGQGPHGELGLGLDRKSSSKPTFIPGLEGCHVLSLGCGYGTTVFVVRDTEDADRAAIAKIPVLNPSATDGLAAANSDDVASKPAVGKKSKAK